MTSKFVCLFCEYAFMAQRNLLVNDLVCSNCQDHDNFFEVRDKTLFTFQNNYNEADLRQCCATKNDLF